MTRSRRYKTLLASVTGGIFGQCRGYLDGPDCSNAGDVSGGAMLELVRVVTWNLAYGKPAGFKRIENRRRQWALLAALAPDIALLQECRPTDLMAHAPMWMSEEYSCVGLLEPGWRLRTSLLVRQPHAFEVPDPDVLGGRERRWLEALPGGVVAAAEVEIADSRFAVASVHALAAPVLLGDEFDDDRRRLRRDGLEQVWHNDVIVAVFEPWVAGRRFIIGGDWNNSPLFDVNYPPPSGATTGPSSAFFARRAAAGWHDTMRRFHDDDVRTYLDAESAPYELDHVFVDAATYDELVGCHALNEPTFKSLSDHAPVVVDFAGALSRTGGLTT